MDCKLSKRKIEPISQSKYYKEVLKKFGMDTAKEVATPMATSCYLDKEERGTDVNQTMLRGMIRSLLYLTTSRPDIMQSICICLQNTCVREYLWIKSVTDS